MDLCGPSVPRMLQIEDKSVIQGESGLVELNWIMCDRARKHETHLGLIICIHVTPVSELHLFL